MLPLFLALRLANFHIKQQMQLFYSRISFLFLRNLIPRQTFRGRNRQQKRFIRSICEKWHFYFYFMLSHSREHRLLPTFHSFLASFSISYYYFCIKITTTTFRSSRYLATIRSIDFVVVVAFSIDLKKKTGFPREISWLPSFAMIPL